MRQGNYTCNIIHMRLEYVFKVLAANMTHLGGGGGDVVDVLCVCVCVCVCGG